MILLFPAHTRCSGPAAGKKRVTLTLGEDCEDDDGGGQSWVLGWVITGLRTHVFLSSPTSTGQSSSEDSSSNNNNNIRICWFVKINSKYLRIAHEIFCIVHQTIRQMRKSMIFWKLR